MASSTGYLRSTSDTRGKKSRGSFLARYRSPTNFAPALVEPSTAMASASTVGSAWSSKTFACSCAAPGSRTVRVRRLSTLIAGLALPSFNKSFSTAAKLLSPIVRPARMAAMRSTSRSFSFLTKAPNRGATLAMLFVSTAFHAAKRVSSSFESSSTPTYFAPASVPRAFMAASTSSPATFTSAPSSGCFVRCVSSLIGSYGGSNW